jgi:hypothetical protein
MSFDDREEREFMGSAWMAALDFMEVKVMGVGLTGLRVMGVRAMGVTYVS